jgi:hypothetical protein
MAYPKKEENIENRLFTIFLRIAKQYKLAKSEKIICRRTYIKIIKEKLKKCSIS